MGQGRAGGVLLSVDNTKGRTCDDEPDMTQVPSRHCGRRSIPQQWLHTSTSPAPPTLRLSFLPSLRVTARAGASLPKL